MTEQSKLEILRYDNGDWESEEAALIHWCGPDCVCGRTRTDALKKFQHVVKMSVGATCPLALEYRWKHMEKANAWCYRGRAQHNLLQRAFCRAYSAKMVNDAEALVAMAGGDAPAGAKAVVKAGLIIKYMNGDLKGMTHLKVLGVARRC
eukprot:9357572-Pyramimonas_sp.AAC.1